MTASISSEEPSPQGLTLTIISDRVSSGFILLTISTDTEIFPANEWEQAGDLLIWNYRREDGKTLIWYFIREGADTSVNN